MGIDRRALLQGMGFGLAELTLSPALLAPSVACKATTKGNLPRSTPEQQGISSDAILSFLAAAAGRDFDLHSLMLVRHGHVVAEGWWAPYRREAIHSLYSLSKSFTATAIGFAITERKLHLGDRVIDFFPDKLPALVSEHLAALTVEHLLTMSAGHAADPIGLMTREDDWVKVFLSVPVEHAPGTEFIYSTGASYMLSAIVQKVSGQTLLDYLESRLFAPLEIDRKSWESCPHGINTGGWGLSLTTESLAKFGQLYLQRGMWNGAQLLPAQWIDTATTFKIQQTTIWAGVSEPSSDVDPAHTLERLKRGSDWYQGYAYQFWRCRHGAYRGDGAFGQFCIVVPAQDTTVVTTACAINLKGMQTILELIWQHLLPAMQTQALPDNPSSAARLRSELASLSLPLPSGEKVLHDRSRKTFKLEPNDLGARVASFQFRDHALTFSLESAEGHAQIECGEGKWVDGITNMPGTPPKFLTVEDLRPVKVAAAGAWKDVTTLHMQWCFYETPHCDSVTCRFSDADVEIEFMDDVTAAGGGKGTVLRGRLIA